MFGMLPFERTNDNFFDTFDNFQRKFFGESGTNMPPSALTSGMPASILF